MSVQLGNALIQTADIGKSLITSLTKFITYRKVQDPRFENLYATLSITSSMLAELGETINQNEHVFVVKDEMIRPVQEGCKSNFSKLLVMVNEALSDGVWKNDGTIGGHAVTAEVDPWFLITMALGGREEARDFWNEIDDSRDIVVELNDLVKYIILKNLNDKNTLSPEQTIEFKNMNAVLPHLIQRLEKTKKATEAKANDANERPRLTRINSETNSDITLAAQPGRISRPIVKDIDDRSISSWNSFDSRSVIGNDTEVYEEWILRWNEPIKNMNKSWSFLGLKFKSFYEDTGFWGTDPELRTKEEMKEQERLASANLSPAQHRVAMEKAIRAIPNKGGAHIDYLLEERTDSSNTERAKRQWSVVAVRAKPKFTYSSAKKWGKDKLVTEWLVTIKGETVDNKERSRSFRRDNPWSYRTPSTYYNPPRGRAPRNNFIRARSRSPSLRRPARVYRSPIMSPLPPPQPWIAPRRAHRGAGDQGGIPEEDYRNGTVAVSKILSKPEAEKRIQEIWNEMTTKPTAEESA